MPTLLTALLFALLAQAPSTAPSATPPVIETVMQTAGRDAWNDGKRLRFTFNVDVGGETKTSRAHDWNLLTGDDAVTANGKTTTVNVWSFDAAKASDAERAAFQQWTNDSYWLLMPLKLGDPGVKFGPVAMTRDLPPSRATVTMSFESVGLTPGDEYDLAIDLRRNIVDGWTYRPSATKSVTWTWQDYADFNGLHLSTNHVNADPNGPRIHFTGVAFDRN